jgi:hypothetical protein
MKGFELFLVILVAAFILWLTVSRSNEKFSAHTNMQEMCMTGCTYVSNDDISTANTACEKQFTDINDINNCLMNSRAWKARQGCNELCASSCK